MRLLGRVVWQPKKRLLTFNEGGAHLTISIQPFSWLRIYAFGKVFNIGGFKHG